MSAMKQCGYSSFAIPCPDCAVQVAINHASEHSIEKVESYMISGKWQVATYQESITLMLYSRDKLQYTMCSRNKEL